jgi:hypothetical protein
VTRATAWSVAYVTLCVGLWVAMVIMAWYSIDIIVWGGARL